MMASLRIFFLCFFCAITLPVIADRSSAKLAKQLAPQLQHLEKLEGGFSQQRHISILSLPLQSSGKFSYTRGEGLVWETLEPVRSRVVISSTQGVTVASNGNTAQTVTSSKLLAEIFLGVFSGDFSQIDTLFNIAAQPLVNQSTNRWAILLTPKDKRLGEHITSIQIEGSAYVESIFLNEGNGDGTDIKLQVLSQTK